MAHLLSNVATVRLDSEGDAITDYSNNINSVVVDGGNALVEDTGIGDNRRTEVPDIKPIQSITLNGFIDTTSEALVSSLVEGTSLAKTVEILQISGQYLSGEGMPEAVQRSLPIGLQTFSLTLHSADTTGFIRTSVASS